MRYSSRWAAAQLPPLQPFLQLLVLAAVAECQQLILSPSNTNWDVELNKILRVTCSAADISAVPQNLKWFGPKNYFDVSSGSSETNVIKSRAEMPRDPLTSDYSSLYTESESAISLSLFIGNIQLNDGGVYSCRGKVQGVDSVVNITVRPYASLDIHDASVNQHLINGSEYGMISCRVQGASPIVQWQINGRTLDSSGSSKYEMTPNGLRVYNPTASDRGRYTCRGVLPATGFVKEVIIKVDVYAGSATGAATLTTSAEGQPSRDTADPSDPFADLPTHIEPRSPEADQPSTRNCPAADVDTPARRTSKRGNQGQPPGYLENYVTKNGSGLALRGRGRC